MLSIIELGGYPDFRRLYEQHGYQVETVTTMRKATRALKQYAPDVIVAEFNFQSDFRDRTSSLETLMAAIQSQQDVKVIVFYEEEYLHQFERLRSRFNIHAALPFPIDEHKLVDALRTAS